MNIRILLFMAGFFVLCPALVSAASSADVERRLENLEENLELYKDEIKDLEQQLQSPVHINGYVDAEYHTDSRDSKKNGFRLHHLSLFFKKELAEKWRFFSEIEYEDAPKFEGEGVAQPAPAEGEVIDDAQGKIFVEAVNIDYLWNPKANFRVGRFFTPAGIWSIDHYPPFVPTQLRPQHIRNIFPQLVDGVASYGTLSLGETFLTYDVYMGNGEGNTAKKDENSHKAYGVRAVLLLPVLKRFELGASFYDDVLNNGDAKSAQGIHVKIQTGDLSFQAEYADASIEPAAGGSSDTKGYYAQLLYGINDSWGAGLRHDFFAEVENTGEDSTINSVFVNYHINKDILIKLEHHEVELELVTDEDYNQTILSLVYYLAD
jgi:hypothetical protein